MAEMIFSARFPPELVDELKEIADTDSCSLSSVVRRACLKYIADRKRMENNTPKRIPIESDDE